MKKIILILTTFISLIGYANGKDNKNEFYFYKEPYISPRIIEDMATWISDGGDQVVAINLNTTQGSDRYDGYYGIRKVDDNFPFVEFERKEGYGYFAYKYIGELSSGIKVVEIFDNGGGTLTTRNLVFFLISKDKGITFDIENQKIIDSEERILISRLGSVPSYRYKDIKIIDDKLQMKRIPLKETRLSLDDFYANLNFLKENVNNGDIQFTNYRTLKMEKQMEFNKQSDELLNYVYNKYMNMLETTDEKNKLKRSERKWLKFRDKKRNDLIKKMAIDTLYDPSIPKNEQKVNMKDANYDILKLEDKYIYVIKDSLRILDRVEVLLEEKELALFKN